jgi:zinc transporter, ZIP family
MYSINMTLIDMEINNIVLAFGLTLFAGLSTGIGGAVVFFAKHTNTKLLSLSMGFSAGVMIYVSFVEILPESVSSFAEAGSGGNASLYAVLSFFVGVISVLILDRLIPSFENPHEIHRIEEIKGCKRGCGQGLGKGMGTGLGRRNKCRRLFRVGVMTAFVIALHNFPEGLATFFTSLKDIRLGIPIAIAIAIHNIPEGISIAVPIFCATGKRSKAFWFSFLSGLAEPVGALVGYLVLSSVLDGFLFGSLLGGVAGIMVFISLDQLLPAAEEYGEHHLAAYGTVAGMAVMAASLLMLG